jgi:hypothetical protein
MGTAPFLLPLERFTALRLYDIVCFRSGYIPINPVPHLRRSIDGMILYPDLTVGPTSLPVLRTSEMGPPDGGII